MDTHGTQTDRARRRAGARLLASLERALSPGWADQSAAECGLVWWTPSRPAGSRP
ncbi:hypothetical protein [Halorientalis persicus]|uniref:hypothetical protein n=1 Tax=Halorientalis persicus TaxID=1367881 RepID=UPI0014800377|nr:hypothetical protein [Halorientalis persicus]